MKYFLLILFCLSSVRGLSQSVNGVPISQIDADYIEIVGIKRLLSPEVTISLEFGQQSNAWNKKSTTVVLDKYGQTVYFNSMIDALNFFSNYGYEFLAAYAVTHGNQNVYHYLMGKRNHLSEPLDEHIVSGDEHNEVNLKSADTTDTAGNHRKKNQVYSSQHRTDSLLLRLEESQELINNDADSLCSDPIYGSDFCNEFDGASEEFVELLVSARLNSIRRSVIVSRCETLLLTLGTFEKDLRLERSKRMLATKMADNVYQFITLIE